MATAAETSNVPATTDDGLTPGGLETRSDLLFGFHKLTLLRQIGLMVGLAASVALGVAVVLWAQEPNYQPILSDVQSYDPSEISQLLNEAGIDHRIEPRTGALLVVSDKIYDARLKLAAAGVTGDKTVGFELLDKEQGLGTSQFMESTRYRRGLEGELARTIASLRNVRSARVHLAIPKQSVFVRDARKPTASVFVDVLAGRRLGEEQIEAIVNLVASSVPEMNKGDVTVVDQKGNLLSRNGENTRARVAAEQFEYNRKVEDTLNTRVAGILESVVGAGRFRAEVTAELDFSAVEQAEELYNPDQQAVRSEQILNEQRVAGADGGIPGALSNQPPGEATVPEVVNNQQGQGGAATDMRDLRRQTVRNFEVDRTVSYTRQDQGRMRRLTVAVAVDDLRRVDPETGKLTYVPWPQEELQRLTLLVRDAVGYSAARGDSVTVVNTPFALPEEQVFEEPQFWEQPWFWDLMKQVLAGLAILVLVLGLLRPTLRNLSSTAERERDKALAGEEDGLEGLDRLESDSVLRGAIEGGSEFLLPSASEGYDRQLNALKGLIAEDPARVAQVVRQWVNADE